MKWSLPILALALSLSIQAQHLRGIKGLRIGNTAGGCALALQDGETYNSTSEFSLGRWVACRFTTVQALAVCSVELRLDTFVGSTETLDVAIYTDNSDQPGVIVGSFSPTISSGLVLSDAFYTFILSPSLSATTTYWLVIRAGDTDVGVIIPFDNQGESPKDIMFSGDGTSWTDQDVNSVFNFRINAQ